MRYEMLVVGAEDRLGSKAREVRRAVVLETLHARLVRALELHEQRVQVRPVVVCDGELAVLARENVLSSCQSLSIIITLLELLTSSKSSNLSRQFSQYPGFGSFLTGFFFRGAGLRCVGPMWSALSSSSS